MVFVIGLMGKPLMPTKEKKARILLKKGKAVIYKKLPFTIRLLYKTGGATQHINLGIDKVRFAGAGIGWVTGFTGTSCRVQDRDGNYVTLSDGYTQVPTSTVTVLKHNGNWLRGPKTVLGKG